MRPVNLLPASRRIREGGSRPGSAYVALGVLGAMLLAVLVYVLTANGLTSKQDELAKVKAETTVAQQRAAALGDFGNFAQIKQTREASITQLAQSRIDWERLVRELSRVLPDKVFISSLEAAATKADQSGANTGPSLNLTGCAPSNPGVAELLVRLRKLHRASEVTLQSSARTEGGECGDGYTFTLSVAFTPAAPPAAPERVPAHLGGGS